MHLFFLSRGIKHDVDRMVEQLASLHLPMDNVKDEKGEPCPHIVQCHLQPVQLHKLIADSYSENGRASPSFSDAITAVTTWSESRK